MTPIAPHISTFLQEFLPKQRGASPNTCDSYAYCFQLFFNFAAPRLKTSPCNLCIEQLDGQMVSKFLEHLEVDRKCSISTRNTRLAAIKSFFRFLEYKCPTLLEQTRQILGIPSKKTEARLVGYLDKDEVDATLGIPDLNTRLGIRDYAMIYTMVTTGVRVSELLGLGLQDLVLSPTASIRVIGKGRKERELPLSKETVRILRKGLAVRGDIV